MRHPFFLVLTVLLASFMFLACESKSEGDKKPEGEKTEKEAPKGDEAAPEEAAAEEAPAATPGEVVLEEFEEPYLGKMMMPKGAEASNMSDKGGHYKLALTADGSESLYLDYETVGGAESLEKALAATKWTAPGNAEVVNSATNEAGVHVVELERESDKKIFVLGFRPANYIKCWGPDTQLDNCKAIINSIPMPAQ